MKDVDRIRIRKVYASCPGWPSGGSKELSSQTQIYAIPCRLQLPTNKWRSAGPGRSLYLLSLTGLAALGGQYHSLSGTEFSASNWVTCLLPATQAGSRAGSKVYIWNVFGLYPSKNQIHFGGITPHTVHLPDLLISLPMFHTWARKETVILVYILTSKSWPRSAHPYFFLGSLTRKLDRCATPLPAIARTHAPAQEDQ